MDKKIVSVILVILISFCFLSIVVADNDTQDDNATDSNASDDSIDANDTDSNATDQNTTDENKTDNNKTKDKNKTDDKSHKNYILAKGHGNDIEFSDGFRGFILDYSKSPASSGDEFKSVSASKASNSNTLKQAIMGCYKYGLSGQIGSIMAEVIQSGSAPSKVSGASASSSSGVVKINNHTVRIWLIR